MVLGPLAVIMALGGMIVAVTMVMIMAMAVIVVMMGVFVGHCHKDSVARLVGKFSPIASLLRDFHIGPVGSLPGARQTKLLASLMSPAPLYLASCG